MQMSIQATVAQVNRDLGYAVPKLTQAATFTALNKTSAKIGTQFRRELARETGVAQKHFKKRVKQYKARYFRLEAKTFMGLRASIPLAKIIKGRKGVGKYEKLIGESLDGMTSADVFMATMPNGHQGLYVRSKAAAGKSGKDATGRSKRGRLPIQEVKLRFDKVAPGVLRKAGDLVGPDEFQKQYTYDLKRRLERVSTTGARRSRA